MSGKRFCLASLVAAVLGLGSVRAEGPANLPPAAPIGNELVPAPAPASAHLMPSRWITYDRQPGCCGPTGKDGPIDYELYARSGIAFPVQHGGLGGSLDNGWMIEAGGRTLFFNANSDAACVIDIGIGNTYNRVGDRRQQYQLFNVGPNQLFNVPNANPPQVLGNRNPIVTGSDLNRTYVSGSLGKELYLWGSAEQDGCSPNWRVGFDLGGRWGTEKLDLNETRHLTRVNESVFGAVHTDLEIPYGQVIFEVGLRLEYGYTWSNILPSNNSDVQDLNLLISLGMRF